MAAPDLSALSSLVDFSPVTIAILGVAASFILVVVRLGCCSNGYCHS